MKGKTLLAIAMGITVLGVSAVYAGWTTGCNWFGPNASAATVRKFLTDSSALRNELMAKEFELRQEYAKAEPDQKRLDALGKEAGDLRAEIQSVAGKHGFAGGMINCGMPGQGMMCGMNHQGMAGPGAGRQMMASGGMCCMQQTVSR